MERITSIKNNELKKIFTIVILIIFAIGFVLQNYQDDSHEDITSLDYLYTNNISGQIITLDGKIIKILPDDNKGDKHQRFIIQSEGYTLLVAHNIDVSKKVPVNIGDGIRLKGEYEWNEKGGVIHWTHRDNKMKHEHGWIKFRNKIYQ